MTLQEMVDSRWTVDMNQKAENDRALWNFEKARDLRRGNEPLPQYGLFDEVARDQLDLFE